MKTSIAVAVAVLALCSFGCATQYRSLDDSLTGGFTETRLAPDQWRVFVQGNAFTTRSEAEQILMRRCAELALEQGKRWFELDTHDAWMNRRISRSGSVYATPSNAAIVTAVDEKNRRAFDAVEIVRQTDEVAGGKLSRAARETLRQLTNAS